MRRFKNRVAILTPQKSNFLYDKKEAAIVPPHAK